MSKHSEEASNLPEWYKPSDMDVICSWARQNHHHAGNKRFRALIDEYAPQYVKATTKFEKTQVIAAVIEKVRQDSPEGGFVKKDFYSGRWYEIGDEKARDKVGHAIRKAAEELQLKNGVRPKQKKSKKAVADAKAQKAKAMKIAKDNESTDAQNKTLQGANSFSSSRAPIMNTLMNENLLAQSFSGRAGMPNNPLLQDHQIMPRLPNMAASSMYDPSRLHQATISGLTNAGQSQLGMLQRGQLPSNLFGAGQSAGLLPLSGGLNATSFMQGLYPSGNLGMGSSALGSRLAALRGLEMQDSLPGVYPTEGNALNNQLLPNSFLGSNTLPTRALSAAAQSVNAGLSFQNEGQYPSAETILNSMSPAAVNSSSVQSNSTERKENT